MVETVTRSESTSSTKPALRSAPKKRLTLRLISSTSIITILLFGLINLAVEKFDPLEHLFWTGLTGARQHIFVSKLPRLLSSSANPDILLLGSSVSLYPAVRADDALAGRKARWDFWYERNVILPYDKVQFLEHHLANWSGHPVSVSNASVAGSLVSDQYLILKKYLATGKKTKLLILCLSPRDFLDNFRTDLDSTPTHNVLGDWSSLPELITKGASWQSIVTVSLGNISNYYLHRQEYNYFLTHLAAKNLDRPVNLYEATKKPASTDAPLATPAPKHDRQKKDTFFDPSNKAVFKQPPNTLGHLDEYKRMYQPIDRKQLVAQTASFNKFLGLAAKNNIPVLIVSTPLPTENTDLLPPPVLKKYYTILATSCAKHGASLLQPDSQQPYETALDFEDASHMNTRGGIKFYTSILETIKTNSKLAANIQNKI